MSNYELEYYQLEVENKMSNLWKLDWKDILNGLIMAIIGPVLFYLLDIFASIYELIIKHQPFSIYIDFKAVLAIAIFSALLYFTKRFFSGTTGNVLQK